MLPNTLLACAALLCCLDVHAQGRGPSATELRARAAVTPEVARATKLVELDAWLRQLTGRYRSGRGQYEAWTDCVGIGDGPGVHCIRGQRDGAPTMTMYGVDPDVPGIRYLQVDGRSIAQGDVGTLSGDTVTFSRVPCPTSVDRQARVYTTTCEQQLRIFTPPGGRYVLLQTWTTQRVYVPTPPGRPRPPGNPVTRVVEFSQNVQLDRLPAQAGPVR